MVRALQAARRALPPAGAQRSVLQDRQCSIVQDRQRSVLQDKQSSVLQAGATNGVQHSG